MTHEALVLREQDARGVVTLTLNRPQAFNALSQAMLDALQAELDRVAADTTARVVVIRAAGRAFCAGHDLKEMRAEPSLAYYERLFAQCARMMLTIQHLPLPVIARVHGTATAAGCQLVAMCDLAVAASDARFAVSGINVGLFCSTPSVALSRNLGRKAAFEMLVTGEFIERRTGTRQGPRQPRRRTGSARRRSRAPGGQHRRQAGRGAGRRQGLVLSPARAADRRGLRRCQPHDGLQHDGRRGARRRAGVHRKAGAGLGARLTCSRSDEPPPFREFTPALRR